jgi:Cytochrome c554 and c-prime
MPPESQHARPLGRGGVWGVLLSVSFFLAGNAAAQSNMGPSKCVGCHDHERQARKWQKEEPAEHKGKAHYNTLKQLDAPNSAQWAKAIGLADTYDVKGSCVKCHATVFRGDANAGVSCESCHGPSSKYNDLHQQKGSYAASVAAGLVDLKDKPPTIAKTCVGCHVLTDAKLAAAGHPKGAGFDAGVSIQKLVHWDSSYNFPAITAAGKALSGKAIPAVAVAAVTPPATVGAKPPPAKVGTPTPGAPSAGEPTKATPAAPATEPTPCRAATPAAPATPPAPWDWDQPIRPLPDDYVPEACAEEVTPPSPPTEPARETGGVTAPPPSPAAQRPSRVAPAVPPSLAEETPFAVNMPGAPVAASVSPAVEADAAGSGTPSAAVPRSPAAEAVALRGQAVQLLDKLLRAGARTPGAPEPARPAEYGGPDGELLHLQDEVIALALEALRRPE